jgi:hypothetical protein
MVTRQIKVVVARKSVVESSSTEDLSYWLARTPEERIEAVEILRRQFYGDTIGLQRIVRVVERTRR